MKAVTSLFGGGKSNSGKAEAAAASNRAAEATARASEASARAEASRLAAEQATQNMKTNFATDLANENAAVVVSGGTADQVGATDDLLKKKKGTGGSLSTQLGINV